MKKAQSVSEGAAAQATKEPPKTGGKSQYKSKTLRRVPAWPALCFFPVMFLYEDLLLRFFDDTINFISGDLLYIGLFAIAAGTAITLLLHMLPWSSVSSTLAYLITFFWTVLVCVEHCCKSYFKTYFGLGYILKMTGQVVSDFAVTAAEVGRQQFLFILVSLMPFLFLLVLQRYLLPRTSLGKGAGITLIILLLFSQGLGSALCLTGDDRAVYTHDYTADEAICRFGLCAAMRLEVQRGLTGVEDAPLQEVEHVDTEHVDHPEVKVYEYNKLNANFDAYPAGVDHNSIDAMHRYFSAKAATQKNEYSGMFAGKNLILFTAEAFSPYAISKDLTPTLYRLTHEGFQFNNYYQPGWGQSTTGGEFAVLTGLIPTWINDNLSFYVSHNNDMPFALGNQFKSLGYKTLAYHNNSYTYYNRHLTHPNLGYEFYGVGNGLEITGGDDWPYSDLEMVRNTVDDYIDGYVNDGKRFHTYYMTVSGHANWGWGNAMSGKHKAEAIAAYPNAPQPVQGYIAANLELEAALTYLVDRLEEKGIADETVICLSSDHYPYALLTEEHDYYCDLSGIIDTERDITRYRNTLLLWCGDMDEPVVVDTPCSAIDIVPTLSNLFGLPYDSRLLSGRDIFAENYSVGYASSTMPLVILPVISGNSWVTAAGSYDATTRTFMPNPGVVVPDTYVDTVNAMVDAKYSYAKAVVQYNYYNSVLGIPAEENAVPL